ncbi:MAG TPA: XrtA/PEP-CTERM system TPR-repeat protein PrsT [Rhizomicrobium sp.]|jgi:putative PEP-CTERM system TPR-repeat lipoprotein|nr:XrtA/PEP-CTERM system TPR-repeat protein PrsT [Rhizomicrobium sp.]
MERTGLVGLFGAAAVALLPVLALADDAGSYLQSAHQLEKAHDLRGAQIQLRNAAQAAAGNGGIRLELAKIYLALHNPNAAEAELFAAHIRGVKEEVTAPLMAQTMVELGAFGDLLKNVPAGNRPAKTESIVRSYRGMAEMGLNEVDRARTMFADAERLDPKSPLPLMGEMRLLTQQRQLDAAAQKADEVLKLDPRNSDALDAKGLLFAMRGNIDAAMQQYAAALATDPHNLRALVDRAGLEVGRGKLAAAETDLAAIRKAAPGSVMAIHLQATIDAQRGKYRDADVLLERLRGAMNSFPPIYLLAAEVKFRLNQLDQADGFARKFIAQAGDDPRAWQLLGAIALKRGNLEGGIAALQKAVELAPGDVNGLAALGQAYIAHGDLDKAKAVFAEAAAKAPGNAPLATERALTDFARGDRQASLGALRNVFKGGNGSLMAGPPLVIEALQLGQIDVAEAAARQLVAHDAANPTYQELLAAVRIAQRDYAGAEALLRALLAKQPNLSSARRDLAQVYLATNRAALAKKLYQDRLNANPKEVDSLEALADIAFGQKDDNGAIDLLNRAQSATPTDPRPSLRILAILQARKKWPEAIGRAHALQAKFGKDPGVEDALDQLYFQSGNHAVALAAYKAGAAKFPGNATVLAHYAAILAANKNYSAAAPIALRAVQLDPRSADLKRGYVTLTYLAKGTDAALAASRAMTNDKTGTAAALMTADVLAGNGNVPGAIALLEKQQKQSPSSPVMVKLASLYQRDNQPDLALHLLGPWTAAHADDADARFALAQLDSAIGKLDDALVQYEWLVTKNPDNPVILNNLAWLYNWKRDPRARATAEKAMKLAPSSGSVSDTLGWILEGQGDTAGAAKYLAQASASQPADGTIQYHYAVVLSKTGKRAEARAVLQKLLATKAGADTLSSARTLLASLGTGP